MKEIQDTKMEWDLVLMEYKTILLKCPYYSVVQIEFTPY